MNHILKLVASLLMGLSFVSGARAQTVGPPAIQNVYFSAHLSASQTGISANTPTKVQFNTADINTGGYYDNTTNYRFTPLVAGTYRITVTLTITSSGSAASNWIVYIYKNGSGYKACAQTPANTNTIAITLTCESILSLNGSSDYIEAWGASPTSTTASFTAAAGGVNISSFEGQYIGP